MNTISLIAGGALAYGAYRSLSQVNQSRVKKALVVGSISAGCIMLYSGYKDFQTYRQLDALDQSIQDLMRPLIAELKKDHENCLEFFSGKTISFLQSSINCAEDETFFKMISSI